ncbi:MAG: HNH endonuclease [Candidatus Parvarchaeota archaeon]|nr:HNH endonuclease [Candidatus Parvarchaeota archaeon]MCW1295949.1 HNH endonuclease [Candidatus Parvarchaeum tengchongense]MCW1299357.1 HNH endonuclease [Candidatus Parvarchaeum tengchongense]MCW1312715.1 HNH endonuclease [Candidatus Parvarchaeum tengchongense]
MGILDEDYDIWTGKKRKKSKGNNYNGGILGSVPSIFGESKKSKKNSQNFNLWGDSKNPTLNKRKKIPKRVRTKVWKTYNGNKMQGKCYVCGDPISFDNFDLGHVRSIAHGGTNNPRNLRPICRSCNGSMGTQNLEAFKRKYRLS